MPVRPTYIVVCAVEARRPEALHPLKHGASLTPVKLARDHLDPAPVPRRRVQQQRGCTRCTLCPCSARGVLQHRLGRYPPSSPSTPPSRWTRGEGRARRWFGTSEPILELRPMAFTTTGTPRSHSTSWGAPLPRAYLYHGPPECAKPGSKTQIPVRTPP